jgi:hypothetical protein
MYKTYGQGKGLRFQAAIATGVALLMLGWTASAGAVTLTNGFLSVSNGTLFATNQYSTGNFSIGYDVDKVGDQLTYTYTLFVPLKSLSHWLLQVSTNFTSADLISESGTGTFTSTTPSLWTPGGSNDGMPTNLFGYKFDTSGVSPTGTLTFTIVTDRLPTNGNFYARDGKGVYAYNTGFSDPINGAFLIVPDSVAVMPEPSSIFLVTGGVLMMMFVTRKRR